MRSKKSGFTLLETLIAILLLSVSITALIWALNAGLFASMDADNVDLALNIAQARLEEIKNTTYPSIVSVAKAAVPGVNGFQQSINVTPINANLKQSDVTVYWSPQGVETNVSLSTYVANN